MRAMHVLCIPCANYVPHRIIAASHANAAMHSTIPPIFPVVNAVCIEISTQQHHLIHIAGIGMWACMRPRMRLYFAFLFNVAGVVGGIFRRPTRFPNFGYACSKFKTRLNQCSERLEFASKSVALRRYGEHRKHKIKSRSNLFNLVLRQGAIYLLYYQYN